MDHTGTVRHVGWPWAGACRVLCGMAALTLFLGGCGTPAGRIFDPAATVHRWPAPPDEARLAYVGQFRTEADLKPAKGAFKGLGEKLFGKDAARAMLRPMAVCTDGPRLFVADSDLRVVHVFNLATRKYAQWAPPKGARPFRQPVALAFDRAAGRLLVADSQDASVMVFGSDGRLQGTMGDNVLRRPCGVAVDAGRVLVVDSAAHQVSVFEADGHHVKSVGVRGSGLGEFNYPTSIAVDSQRRVYVSDSLNFRVQVFDAEFNPIRQIGKKGDMPGYFAQPKGLALDSQDNLYVVDGHFEAVQIFDQQGQLLMYFGHEGHGPGEFWLPTGIHADKDGRVWVADSFNKRVQVFELLDKGVPDAK
jgi:DNA-binding beta-propeller fold protein YncE